MIEDYRMPDFREQVESETVSTTLDRHHRLAAEVRCLLHNGGAGPNLSQLKRCDAMLREIAGLPPELESSFTLNEVMDAVKDAFARVGGETARDCVVEQTIRETLSARPEHKEVFNESGREKLRNDGKRRTTNHNPSGRH